MPVLGTAAGCALALAGLATYAVHATAPGLVDGQPTLVVLGLLTFAYAQVIYPAVTSLSVGPDSFVLRTLPGRRAVPWARVARMQAISGLTPAGRGGNLSGIRVRDAEDRLILIIPDVFTPGRDELLAVLERARTANRAP